MLESLESLVGWIDFRFQNLPQSLITLVKLVAKVIDFLFLIELQALNDHFLFLDHCMKLTNVLPRLFEFVVAELTKLIRFLLKVLL